MASSANAGSNESRPTNDNRMKNRRMIILLSGSVAQGFGASTLRLDEGADLRGIGEDHGGAIAHHAGTQQGGLPLRWAVGAGVGLEAQVALPELSGRAASRRHAVGVAAVADGGDLLVRRHLLQRWHLAGHHAAHHAVAAA